MKQANKSLQATGAAPSVLDGTMKFEHHPCSQRQSPVAVPELWR
jgi:hypothetical protein